MDINQKQTIRTAIIIFMFVIGAIIIGLLMLKYETEGETNMPFKLSKIMIVSTADGVSVNDEKISIMQCNDFYLSIEKNDNASENIMIKNIYIENIKVMSEPSKGTVKFYKPAQEGKTVYTINEENIINDSLTYSGDSQTSLKDLTISNQGGTISFRTCVEDIGEFAIDQEAAVKEVSYNNDGTLLERIGIVLSEIKYNIAFDMIIELSDGKMYKGYINETLPIEDNEQGGVNAIEKVDLSNIAFKRIKIK